MCVCGWNLRRNSEEGTLLLQPNLGKEIGDLLNVPLLGMFILRADGWKDIYISF